MAHSLEHHYKNGTPCTIAFSTLFEVSLNQFSHRRDDLPDSVKPVGLDTTRQYHLESILRSFDGLNGASLNVPERRHSCGVSLECLAGYSDLLAIHPNLQEISSQLFDGEGPFQIPQKVAMSRKDCCSIEYLAVALAKVKLRLYSYDYNLHPNLAHVSELFKSLHSRHERNNLLCHFRDLMPSLSLKSKKELCFDFDVNQKGYLDLSQLLRIEIGISSLNDNANPRSTSDRLTAYNLDRQIGDLSSDVSRILIILCKQFSQRNECAECMLSMQCVNMLLQHHTRVVSQWHIDELFAAITIKASTMVGQREKSSGTLYIGLCRLLGTILAVHRAKIGGRFHLVLLALQALLRCLFVSYQENGEMGNDLQVFGEAHAAAYGRILSMICDPTVSSVTRSRNRSRLKLNDETKKARSIAGQYLPYLIMDFCGYQLTGRLLPGMRTALNAGLYAVFAVMPADVMRTMNAAMDSSSRSVFKELYKDYRGFGKWMGG